MHTLYYIQQEDVVELALRQLYSQEIFFKFAMSTTLIACQTVLAMIIVVILQT